MRTLFLARHALAESNRDGLAACTAPGSGLTAEGVEQARRLGAELADERIELGIASEHRRTQDSLDLALAGRDIPRLVVPELNEIHFGSFDGGLLADYRAWAGRESPSLQAPGGGESRADAAARYARAIHAILARPERSALAIGHALGIRYVLDAARGLVPAALMAEPVEHAVPYRLEADELERAAQVLERWSGEPRFRDPSQEGRPLPSAGRRWR